MCIENKTSYSIFKSVICAGKLRKKVFHKVLAMPFEILWNNVWNTSMRLADFVWPKRQNLQACIFIDVDICAYNNI